MMKSAKNRSCDDLAEPPYRPMIWQILGKGKMRPAVVVVGAIGSKDSAQMGLAKDDEVIEAVPADRADQPLRMSGKISEMINHAHCRGAK